MLVACGSNQLVAQATQLLPRMELRMRRPILFDLALTSPIEDKARWLVEHFLRLDLSDLSEDEKHDLYQDAVNFVRPADPPYFEQIFPKMAALQREIRDGVGQLWKGKKWRLPAAPPVEIQRRESGGGINAIYIGSFEPIFRAAAASILVRLWSRLRQCAYRKCKNIFIPTRRQVHCSPQCTKRENWARFVEKTPSRKRDYKAEYAQRWANRPTSNDTD